MFTEQTRFAAAMTIAERIAALRDRAGLDTGCLPCAASDVRPLPAGHNAWITPTLDAAGAAAIRLVADAVCLLPYPEIGPATDHVEAATLIAALARLAAPLLPCVPVSDAHAVDWSWLDRCPAGWLPDPGAIRRAAARLVELADEQVARVGFVDAELATAYLADVYDAARAYAATVELVDALYGVGFAATASPA